MGDKESEVTTIPQIRRVFRMAKAELDALAGLRDGALAYGTDTGILYRQNGDGAANWEAITSQATKAVFIPFQCGVGVTVGQYAARAVWSMADANDEVNASFMIPHDFSSLVSVIIVGRKDTDGTIDWTVLTLFGAIDESPIAHTDTDTQNGLAMVNNITEDVDISAAFAGIAALDWIGIQFTLDAISAGTYDVFGIIFQYN